MLSEWWNRQVECTGLVLFRGSLAPRPEELPSLEQIGFTVEGLDQMPGMHWVLQLSSPQWGRAQVAAWRNPRPLPREMVDYAVELTPEEKELALLGQATISVRLSGTRDDLLRDRKTMLRLLGVLMDDDGVVAIDYTSRKFWSRAALDDELSHDADVDIDALYTLHAVGDDSGKLAWLHTHGLAEIGLFDFDLIYPDPALVDIQNDVVRAVALTIAEGKLRAGGAPILFAGHDVYIQAIEAATFDRLASPADRAPRELADDDHIRDRCVICEPVGRLARFLRQPVRPATYFNTADESRLIFFSHDSGALMARRARGSLPLLRRLMEEFAEFDFPVAAKICYVVDGGGENDVEHMWFHLHAVGDDTIDATLAVNPFRISRMKLGDRGHHPIDLLTDWLIPTPAGPITPRNTTPARLLRPHKQELLQAIRQEKSEN